MRVRPLDDHIALGIHVDAGRVARVGLHEPNDNGDVVSHSLKRHRDGAFGLEEIDGATIVVGEGRGLGLEGRVGGGEGDQMLADEPFGILRVREGGGAPLGEDGAQELLAQLRVRRGWTAVGCRWHHREKGYWVFGNRENEG